MRYFFGHKLNVLPSTQVLSEPVIVKTLSDADQLRVTGGATLLINNIAAGSQNTIVSGDEIRVQVKAPAVLEQAAFYEIYQGLELVGIFSVSSQQEPALVRDEDYAGVPLYEVLPKDSWTLNDEAYLGMIVDGTYSEIELQPKLISNIPQNRIHIIDYHRKLMYVVNAETGNYEGSVTLSKSPISEQTIHVGGLRAGTAILNDDGTASIYDNFYTLTKTVSFTSTIDLLQPYDGGFYSINGNNVYQHAAPNYAASLYYAGSEPIVSFVASPVDGKLILATETSILVCLEGAITQTIDVPYKAFSLEYLDNYVYVACGELGILLTVNLLTDEVTETNLGGNITYVSKQVNSGQLWLSDYDKHLIIDASTGNPVLHQMSNLPIGITSALGNVFSPMLYTNLPPRFVESDIIPETIVLAPIDSELGMTVTTPFTLTGINENIQVAAPVGLHTMSVNGSPTVDVPNDTEIAVGFNASQVFYQPLQMPIVYGDKIAYVTVNPPAPEELPDEFYFEPISHVEQGVEVCSMPTLVQGLSDDSVEVELTVTGGTVKVNGTLVESPTMIKNGDTVILCGISQEAEFKTTLVTASILNLNVYFAITTYSTVIDTASGTTVSLEPRLYEGLGSAVISGLFNITVPASYGGRHTVRIPDVYDVSFTREGQAIPLEYSFYNSGDTDFELTSYTGQYPGKYYPLPIITNSGSKLWLIRTLPVMKVHNFTFGEHSSDHMTYPVDSDTVVVGGVTPGAYVPMVVPVGIKVFVNGVDVSNTLKDVYGYPRKPTRVKVTLGDEITLKALPNGVYGEMITYIITIGFTEGQFRITTPDADPMKWLDDLLKSVRLYNLKQMSTGISTTIPEYTSDLNYIDTRVIVEGEDTTQGKAVPSTSTFDMSDAVATYTNVTITSTFPDTAYSDYTAIRFGLFAEFIPMSYQVVVADTELTTALEYEQRETFADDLNAIATTNTLDVYHSLVDWTHDIHYTQWSVSQANDFGAKIEYLQDETNFRLDDFEFIRDVPDSSLQYSLTNSSGYLSSLVSGIDREMLGYTPDYTNPKLQAVDQFESVHALGEYKELTTDSIPFDLYPQQISAVPFWRDRASNNYLVTVHAEYLLDAEILSNYDLIETDNVGSIMSFYDTVVADIDVAVRFTIDQEVSTDLGTSIAISSSTLLALDDDAVKSADQKHIYVDDNFITTREPYSLSSAAYTVVVEGLYPPSVDKSGYFDSRSEAESDARSAGYEDGEFTAIYVEGKGWAWNIPFSCTSMCSAECPPTGYIQGG